MKLILESYDNDTPRGVEQAIIQLAMKSKQRVFVYVQGNDDPFATVWPDGGIDYHIR